MAGLSIRKLVAAGLPFGLLAITGGAFEPTGRDRPAIADRLVDSRQTDHRKDDLDRIQGSWVRVSTDGVKTTRIVRMVVKKAASRPEEKVPEGAAMFVFTWKTEGDAGEGRNRVLLDPSATPKTIDFFPERRAEGVPKICPGIYRLEGDTLTVCFLPVTGKRPSEFAPGRRGQMVDVYRHATP